MAPRSHNPATQSRPDPAAMESPTGRTRPRLRRYRRWPSIAAAAAAAAAAATAANLRPSHGFHPHSPMRSNLLRRTTVLHAPSGPGRRGAPRSMADDPSLPSSWPIPPLRFEVCLGGDGQEEVVEEDIIQVELTRPEDIDATLRNHFRSGRGKGDGDDKTMLRKLLQDYWDQHVAFVRDQQEQILREARVYKGPAPSSIDRHEASIVARIPTSQNNGLVLEVADSTIEGGGKGIFVRAAGDEDVWQTKGSAFCGYARGGFAADLGGLSRNQRQRTFEFRLDDGTDSTLWFRGNLLSVAEAVQQTKATHLAGHQLVFGDDDSLLDVQPIEDHAHAFRYFVPRQQQPAEELAIQALGQMVNDLAGGYDLQGEDDYHERSEANNVLVLVPQLGLQVSEEHGSATERRVLQPNGAPIMTMCHTIQIPNTDEPMEVGCQYGYHYWSKTDR